MKWKKAVFVILTAVLFLSGCSRIKDVKDGWKKARTEEAGQGSLCERGMGALEDGQYETSLGLFEQAVKEKEEPELSWRGIGIAKMGLEDYEGAIEAFDRALSKAGSDAGELEYDISYYKASALVRLDRLNDALVLYDNLEAYEPEAKTYIGRGAVYARMGNMEMARADFDKAIGEHPKNYERYIEAFRILDTAGRNDIGQEYLKKALEIDKEKDKNNLEKGKVYYYLGQYDKARSELEKIKSDKEPEGLLYLARTYEALGDPAYAQTLYKEYLGKDSANGNIYNMIAVSEMHAGNYQEALDTLQKGIEKAEYGRKNLYRNEIAAYEYLLDFKTAKTKTEEYLKAYPEDDGAAKEYIFLKSRSE